MKLKDQVLLLKLLNEENLSAGIIVWPFLIANGMGYPIVYSSCSIWSLAFFSHFMVVSWIVYQFSVICYEIATWIIASKEANFHVNYEVVQCAKWVACYLYWPYGQMLFNTYFHGFFLRVADNSKDDGSIRHTHTITTTPLQRNPHCHLVMIRVWS